MQHIKLFLFLWKAPVCCCMTAPTCLNWFESGKTLWNTASDKCLIVWVHCKSNTCYTLIYFYFFLPIKRTSCLFVLVTYVFICIQSREVRANHSWSVEMRIEMDSDAGCELTSEPPNPNPTHLGLDHPRCRLMPVINRLLVGSMNMS